MKGVSILRLLASALPGIAALDKSGMGVVPDFGHQHGTSRRSGRVLVLPEAPGNKLAKKAAKGRLGLATLR